MASNRVNAVADLKMVYDSTTGSIELGKDSTIKTTTTTENGSPLDPLAGGKKSRRRKIKKRKATKKRKPRRNRKHRKSSKKRR